MARFLAVLSRSAIAKGVGGATFVGINIYELWVGGCRGLLGDCAVIFSCMWGL